jgi:hypothetical protein
MICTVIQKRSYEEILRILDDPYVEMAEIRLDLCQLSDEEIEDIFSNSDTPLIATCRAEKLGETEAERTGLKRADDGTNLEVETITRDDLLIDVAKVLNLPQIVGALLPIVGGLAEVYIVYTQGDTQEHTVADVGADIEIKGIEGSTSDMQSAVLIIGSLHDIVLKESYGICQAIEGVEVSVGVAIEVTTIVKSLTCQAVQLVCP